MVDRANSQWIGRLALALLGQALPEPSSLAGIIKDLRRGLLALVVAGVLVSAFIILGCFGLYHALLAQGVTTGMAIGIGAGAIVLMAIIFGLIAEKHLGRVSRAKQKLELFPDASLPADLSFEVLLSAFMNGFHEPETKPHPRSSSSGPADDIKPTHRAEPCDGHPIH